jgi:hypothetical protein
MPQLAAPSIADVQNMRSLLAIIVISSLLAFDLALDGPAAKSAGQLLSDPMNYCGAVLRSPLSFKHLPPIFVGLAPSAAFHLDPSGVLARAIRLIAELRHYALKSGLPSSPHTTISASMRPTAPAGLAGCLGSPGGASCSRSHCACRSSRRRQPCAVGHASRRTSLREAAACHSAARAFASSCCTRATARTHRCSLD